ncbi:2898_t:CDS:2, partial [Gigaspora margarita]
MHWRFHILEALTSGLLPHIPVLFFEDKFDPTFEDNFDFFNDKLFKADGPKFVAEKDSLFGDKFDITSSDNDNDGDNDDLFDMGDAVNGDNKELLDSPLELLASLFELL